MIDSKILELMKTNLLFALLATLVLSACNPKIAAIKNELRLIEKTAKDTKQVDFICESAEVFSNVLFEEQGIPRRKLFNAHWDMVCSRNPTTIATYVAFLKAIEKKLPDQLPPVEVYEAMKNSAGSSEVVLYNLGQTVIIMTEGQAIDRRSGFGEGSCARVVTANIRVVTANIRVVRRPFPGWRLARVG